MDTLSAGRMSGQAADHQPAHLRRVMREYMGFFNTARPHQGLEQQIPVPGITHNNTGSVRCHTVLGRIIHDY
jgi:hypothetical protein